MIMEIQMQMDDMRKYFRCIDNCLNELPTRLRYCPIERLTLCRQCFLFYTVFSE